MKKSAKIENWVKLIAHINDSWKKEKGYDYPFTGRDFVDIKHYVRFYQVWGLMALWDIYIETANDWLKKNGLTVYHFTRALPRLLDNPAFKPRATIYEGSIMGARPRELFDRIGYKLKIKP